MVDKKVDKVDDKDNNDVTLSDISFDLSKLEKEKSSHGLISMSVLMFFFTKIVKIHKTHSTK